MTRFKKFDCAPLQGKLIYRPNEYSFDFEVRSESELALRAGGKGTTSLLVGTLQIEVGIETGAALFVWGLHSHSMQWRREDLPRISKEKGGLKIDGEPIIGVSQGLAEVGEWQTTYDSEIGWLCIGSGENQLADSYREFAENTVAGLINDRLVSLWLRPIWATKA